MPNCKTALLEALRHLKQLPILEVGKTEATLEALHRCVSRAASPVPGWATSQGHSSSKARGGHGHALHTQDVVKRGSWAQRTMETLTPAGGGTWALTFPASSSEGAKTSRQELGEGVMLASPSGGSCDTLNTEL